MNRGKSCCMIRVAALCEPQLFCMVVNAAVLLHAMLGTQACPFSPQVKPVIFWQLSPFWHQFHKLFFPRSVYSACSVSVCNATCCWERFPVIVNYWPVGNGRSRKLPCDFTTKLVDTIFSESNVYWTVHHCNSWRMKDQLDVTCYIISLLMCSTCFGH